MKILIASSIVLTSLFLAQDQSKGWPEEEKAAFMENCISSASASLGEDVAKEYCSCAFDEVEKMYPNVEDAVNITAEQMQTLAQTCLAQIAPEKED